MNSISLLILGGALLLTQAAAATPSAAAMNAAQDLIDNELAPLLAGRPFEVDLQKKGRGAIIDLRGKSGGQYQFYVGPEVKAVPTPASAIDVPGKGLLRARLDLPSDWANSRVQAMNRVRQLLRADPDLHPMNSPRGIPKRATDVQKEVLAKLVGRQRSLLMLPPGMGKTVVAGLLANEISADGKPTMVVFVVQNKVLLDQAGSSLADVMNVASQDVHRVYGGKSKNRLFKAGAPLTMASRSTAYREIDDLVEQTKDFDGHILWVLDEASHIGKHDGEFDYILSAIDKALRPQDTLLGLSATPWHTDSGPIHKFFHDHIVAAFVTDEELDLYVSTGRLIELARLVMFRAMEAGYLSPLSYFRDIQYLENGVPARDFLLDTSTEISQMMPPDSRQAFRREWRAHLPLLEILMKDMVDGIEILNGEVTYWDRGIVFAPSIALSEKYAEVLNRLGHRKHKIHTKAFHSNLSDDERRELLAWLEEPAAEHRNLVVIDSLGEAFDNPQLNRIYLTTPYSEKDQVGLQKLLQHLGRLTRIGSHKRNIKVTDFTGAMRRLLFQDVSAELVAGIFTEDAKIEVSARPNRFGITEAITSIQRLTHRNFESKHVEVPPDLPVAANDAERPWTLARLLLDGQVVPAFLSGMPLTARGIHRPLGYYLCQRLRQQPVGKEDADWAGRALLDAMGLTEDVVRDLGITEDLKPHCHRRIFATPRTGQALMGFERELARTGKGSLGKTVALTDSEFAVGQSLFPKLPLVSSTKDETKAHGPWNLARVLLDPMIPGLLGSNAINLATLLLDSEAPLPSGLADVAISYRDRLVVARSFGLLASETATWIYDDEKRTLAIEALGLVGGASFEGATNFTDDTLYALARDPRATPQARRAADTYLLLHGFHPGHASASSVVDWAGVLAAGVPPVAETKPTNWTETWTKLRVILDPISHFLSPNHALEAEVLAHTHPIHQLSPPEYFKSRAHLEAILRSFANGLSIASKKSLLEPAEGFTSEQLVVSMAQAAHHGDRAKFAPLAKWVRWYGTVPRFSKDPARNVESKLTADHWTLARFLLEPRVLDLLMPGKNFRSGLLRFKSPADFLCEQLGGSAFGHSSERNATVAILEALGISAETLSAEHMTAIQSMCAGDLFRYYQESDIEATERLLIDIAPTLFGLRTRVTDFDLTSPSSMFERTPLVPDLRKHASAPGRATRPWTLAELLKHPLVPALAGVGSKSLGLHFQGLKPTRRWAQALLKSRAYSLARSSNYLALLDAPRWARSIESLIAADPSVFGRLVDFTDYDLHVLARETLKGEPRRLVESYLISRGYTVDDMARVVRVARSVPNLNRDAPEFIEAPPSTAFDAAKACDDGLTEPPARVAGKRQGSR